MNLISDTVDKGIVLFDCDELPPHKAFCTTELADMPARTVGTRVRLWKQPRRFKPMYTELGTAIIRQIFMVRYGSIFPHAKNHYEVMRHGTCMDRTMQEILKNHVEDAHGVEAVHPGSMHRVIYLQPIR